MATVRDAAILVLSTIAAAMHAVEPTDHAVGVTVVTQAAPAAITLQWPADAAATQYRIYRRAFGSTSWGAAVATLASSATSWSDTGVAVGSRYEYQVVRTGSVTAYGYQLAGIRVPVVDDRGKVVLLVDATMASPLSSELARLASDLVADGWRVDRRDVSRTATVASVRALVQGAVSNAARDQVLILGHVPVPYSGALYPDGHPEHRGAWPADVIYADLNGAYTDTSTDTSSVSGPARPEIVNVPGDGKFDQSYTTGTSFVGLGRVDLANMPAFALSETELLRRYLGKDHAFRRKAVVAAPRGLIDDGFRDFGGEAFAQSGWRSFTALVGPANVTELDWFTTLPTNDYLLAYGDGGGWFQGAGGVGSTGDFAAQGSRAVFTMLFGSYFGDWDVADNFLRAPLAANGLGLTCCWAGRPNWVMHPMGLGEPIGVTARIRFADPYGYPNAGGSSGAVHVALMGDPTLRLHVVAPPPSASASPSAGGIAVSWVASPDAALGYHVLRSSSANGPFTRLTSSPVGGTTYHDLPGAGTWHYLVKAVRLETSFSGSYFNTSLGAAAVATTASGATAGTSTSGTGTTGTSSTAGTGSTGPGTSAAGGRSKTECGLGSALALMLGILSAAARGRRRR